MKQEPEIVSAIVEMYLSGKEQKEIVEATGRDFAFVRYWLKKKGIFNPERRQFKARFDQSYNRMKEQEAESRLAFLLLEKGFFYIGKAEKKKTIVLSCLVCGGTFERYNDPHFRESAIECPHCLKKKKEEEQRKRTEAFSRTQEEWKRKRTEKAEQKVQRLKTLHKCKYCGRSFSLEEYRKNEGVQHCEHTVFCSSECRKNYDRKIRRLYNKSHGKHQKRAIKFGVGFDKTISLTELIKRNGTRCAICGGTCDLTDYEVINGVWIYGNNYPSIDHIKPMSKGGNHSWENVQVAHRLCNSRKGANVV
jgi:5-methylcytosine-specific restriction endonuclease McrA